MKTKEFLDKLSSDRITGAIREAELKTSGEIRVFISRHPVSTPVSAAQEQFLRLGMEKTQERNGVLIFVAPPSRTFAVVGDLGIHARCGDEFWLKMTAEMTTHFRDARFTDGIVHGVRTAGDLLSQHFPRKPDDKNELPDNVEHD